MHKLFAPYMLLATTLQRLFIGIETKLAPACLRTGMLSQAATKKDHARPNVGSIDIMKAAEFV